MQESNFERSNRLMLFESIIDELTEKFEDISGADWINIYAEARKKYDARLLEEKAGHQETIEKKRKSEQNKRIEEIIHMELPSDWNNAYSEDKRAEGIHTDSINDALNLSLANLGHVDIEYIAQISEVSLKAVIKALKGLIYQNPNLWNECFYKGWETSEQYLSGNLTRKLKEAEAANKKYSGYFADNINAIIRVMPKQVESGDIYVTLGSPWVPPDIIDEFIVYLLKVSYSPLYRQVTYEPISNTWTISDKKSYYGSVASCKIYGTERMEALNILEKTLNMKIIEIFDKVKTDFNPSGKKRVLNQDETIAAAEKQRLIINEFQNWVWKDKLRKLRLEEIFNEKFGSVRKRNFDGEFLKFSGMSQDISLYKYQKDAVAKIVFTPNVLLSHGVGAGKTYIMIAAGMELKRMGISRKNVYVVPNNIVGQWKIMFLELYRDARVLAVEPKNFMSNKRQDILRLIRDEEYDAVIIAYSCFELIPISRSYYKREIRRNLAAVDEAMKKTRGDLELLQIKKDKLKDILRNLDLKAQAGESEIYFDDLHINTLFVDEAHNFKNISIDTKINKVLGIKKIGSKKCDEMLKKVYCVQRANKGRGVIFATGTPITNSVTDIFVMQTYLQNNELKLLDLNHFDNWMATFGEKTTEFEVDVDTTTYRMATRFSKFHNLPELTNLLGQIADFHQIDRRSNIPDFDGYDDNLIPKSKALTGYIREISIRADEIRNGLVVKKGDNMLKITTDGRKAALDIRLADPEAPYSPECKVFTCAQNVFDIYKNTEKDRLTQIVFCDISTPKAGFNIYDELKRLLVSYGISEEDIAFIHHYETEEKRAGLFEKMQKGDIRILLGSTFKLGMGVNVQKKLIAIHHLDVPWRPADIIQREGRILRQGNENSKIKIFRYIADGSFDAYSWQLLESKQRFICQLLSGCVSERNASDIDDTVLNYAEIKALAIGNPLIKERVEFANELNRYCILQRKLTTARLAMEKELANIPEELTRIKDLIYKASLDMDYYQTNKQDTSKDSEGRRAIGTEIFSAMKSHVMQPDKKELLCYQGFNVVLPSNMAKERPAVWLVNNGKYYVETGKTGAGCLKSIDNRLNTLYEFIGEYKDKKNKLIKRQSELEAELSKEESYSGKIEYLKNMLYRIDKRLGVGKM